MAEVIRSGQSSEPGLRLGDGARDVEQLPARELIQGIMEEGRRLVREEVRLAKSELRDEVKRTKQGGAMVGSGGVVAHTGWLVVAAGAVLLLSQVVAAWAAAFIVGAALLVIGALVAKSGSKKLKFHKPEQTVRTLQEDKQWLRSTLHDARSKTHARA